MVIIGLLTLPGSVLAQVALWEDGDRRDASALHDDADATVIRTRPICVDAHLATTLDGRQIVGLTARMFDEESLPLSVDRQVRRGDDRVTWFGSVADAEGGSWLLTMNRGAAYGIFSPTGRGLFEIRMVPGGGHELRQLDPARFKPCACGPAEAVVAPAPAGPRAEGALRGSGDDGSQIDVLVLYTETARIAAGGTAAIESIIDASVDFTNFAYVNSLIDTSLRLVHMEETAYAESGSAGTDLGRLAGSADGHMDDVHALRNTYGADLVALIVDSFDACGIGYLMTSLDPGFESAAFSVTDKDCAAGNLTFAHELGHNQGCHHDHDNGGPPVIYPYAFGHRYGSWRTVMAYEPGTRESFFSNPNVLSHGLPTGIDPGLPGEAYNALVINNTALTVANFRPAIPEDFDPPSPDPMTFASNPAPMSSTVITMAATTATDDSLPVQYYFEETSGNPGGSDSGWQAPTTYQDSGLTPNTMYSYSAKARDSETTPNETTPSGVESTASAIQTPVNMGFQNLTGSSVELVAAGAYTNLGVGASGLFFDSLTEGGDGGINVWQQSTTATVTGLMQGTLYEFRVKARNQLGVETAYSNTLQVFTPQVFADCNNDGVLDDDDVPCFVNALLGTEDVPGAFERCDLTFDGQTNGGDMEFFLFCLITQGC
jgi:hypothetical protein